MIKQSYNKPPQNYCDLVYEKGFKNKTDSKLKAVIELLEKMC